MKRLLTATALVPIVVYVVLFANFWVFLAVLIAVAATLYLALWVLCLIGA